MPTTFMIAFSAVEIFVIYGLPVGVVVVSWLAAALWIFALARLSQGSALRRDLEQRVEAKRRIPSGRGVTLSFGYLALSLLGDNSVQATVLYRLSSWLVDHHAPLASRLVHSFSKLITHADISPQARIGPGFYLYHGLGTVIGKGTQIGARALVCQGVTTGGGPLIGDDVRLWAGAKVIGKIRIGDRAEIGANGVVVSDVPADVVAVGVPATRFLQKENRA